MQRRFLPLWARHVALSGLFLSVLVRTGTAYADALPNATVKCSEAGAWTYCNPTGVTSLSDAGVTIIQAALGLLGTIALFFLIYAGVTYLTSAGSEEKIKQAKQIITGTIIGIGVALLAFSLLQTVITILG
jgi:NADPH-dependent curcumin reductase CurA